MATLNQLAARIANMVNQPDNHELKERAKDMIKTMFANRIRQSVEKHGIDDILKLTFIAPVEDLNYTDVLPTEYRIASKHAFRATKYKVPTPIRIQSDSPFTFVGTVMGEPFMYMNSISTYNILRSVRATHSPTGSERVYFILNGRIVIANNPKSNKVDDRNIPNEVMITAIFENPEEVLTYFKDNDGQDIELPLPNDMLEDIIYAILKTEFNVYPQDTDIKVNNNNQSLTQSNKSRN